MFDLNNDGQISIDELKRVLNSHPTTANKSQKAYMTNLTPSTINASPYPEPNNE